MECAPAGDGCDRSVIGRGNSFRLRSPSLNSVRLRRIFDIFDKNKDGVISVEELGQALALLGLNTDISELESVIRSFVEEGSDGLRYENFEALHRSLNEVFFGEPEGQRQPDSCDDGEYESDLNEAFKVFDEDGDGFISARELQVVLSKLGLMEGREIDGVNMMISSVDKNHDGRVDFFEFKDMMMRTTPMLPS